MVRLRTEFGRLGFTAVETFIASGNVIFETRARRAPVLESRIAGHLEEVLGFPVATFLRTPDALAAVAVASVPGAGEGGASHYVVFLRGPLSPGARTALQALASPVNRFEVQGHEVHWLSQAGIGKAEISTAQLEKALGQPATIRNISSVRKLVARLAGGL